MRSSSARRAPALTALLLGALLTGCAGTSPTAATTSAPAPTVTPSSAVPSSAVPSSAVPSSAVTSAPAVTELTLVLADGEVTGDSPLARLGVGEPVRMTVTSDVADELHVHGVDETVDLEPGEPAVLEFTIESPGRFEVELHDARRVLTRLQVR